MNCTNEEMPSLEPHFDDIVAHYDLSEEFFSLFQDGSRKYSCAYFDRPGLSLSEAQIANVDLHLDALDLQPGMTLLDIGCGWGLTMRRALEKYDVNVIGLTLSPNQQNYCRHLLEQVNSPRSHRVLLQGWEQFNEPVDRIVSIEAIEHFGFDRYTQFFARCFGMLAPGGRMTVQSSLGLTPEQMSAQGVKLTFELARFIKFIITDIFPGGRIPTLDMLIGHGQEAGFDVTASRSLRNHYIKTLGTWATALEQSKDRAIAITDEETYERYVRYLRGCEFHFIQKAIDVNLVTYRRP